MPRTGSLPGDEHRDLSVLVVLTELLVRIPVFLGDVVIIEPGSVDLNRVTPRSSGDGDDVDGILAVLVDHHDLHVLGKCLKFLDEFRYSHDCLLAWLSYHRVRNSHGTLEPALVVGADRAGLTDLLELHAAHVGVAVRHLTGLAHILSAVGSPRLHVCLAIFLRFEGEHRHANPLSITGRDPGIGHSRLSAQLHDAVRALVDLAADLALLSGVRIELASTVLAVHCFLLVPLLYHDPRASHRLRKGFDVNGAHPHIGGDPLHLDPQVDRRIRIVRRQAEDLDDSNGLTHLDDHGLTSLWVESVDRDVQVVVLRRPDFTGLWQSHVASLCPYCTTARTPRTRSAVCLVLVGLFLVILQVEVLVPIAIDEVQGVEGAVDGDRLPQGAFLLGVVDLVGAARPTAAGFVQDVEGLLEFRSKLQIAVVQIHVVAVIDRHVASLLLYCTTGWVARTGSVLEQLRPVEEEDGTDGACVGRDVLLHEDDLGSTLVLVAVVVGCRVAEVHRGHGIEVGQKFLKLCDGHDCLHELIIPSGRGLRTGLVPECHPHLEVVLGGVLVSREVVLVLRFAEDLDDLIQRASRTEAVGGEADEALLVLLDVDLDGLDVDGLDDHSFLLALLYQVHSVSHGMRQALRAASFRRSLFVHDTPRHWATVPPCSKCIFRSMPRMARDRSMLWFFFFCIVASCLGYHITKPGRRTG